MNTPAEIDAILGRCARKEIPAFLAIGPLVECGLSVNDARQAIFAALGGSDVIQIGEDGKEHYMPSGRLVADVEKEMVGNPR